MDEKNQKNMLNLKVWAVLGASQNKEKPAYQIVKC
jgi:predicted CoA-binding protein